MVFFSRALPIFCMAFFCFYLITIEVIQFFVLIPDDAGYYFQIAKNLADGNGSSFDGIHKTNGYQPLWLLVLTAIHWLLTINNDSMLRLILIVQFFAAVFALGLLWRAFNTAFKESVSVTALMIAIAAAFLPSINGMESMLLLAMISALLFIFTRTTDTAEVNYSQGYLLGLVVGAIVLCRLDLIFLPIAIGILWLASIISTPYERVYRLLVLAAFTAGTACAVCPYLALNFVSTGHLLPISGVLKSSFPNINSPLAMPDHIGVREMFGLLGAHMYLLASLIRPFRLHVVDQIGRKFHVMILSLSLTVSFHFIHTLLFMKWAVFWWHYSFYPLVGAIVFGVAYACLLRHLAARYQQFFATILALVIAVVTCTWIESKFQEPLENNWVVQSYYAGKFAKASTDPEAIFAMKDAGIFGYISERRTINLDGLVNNFGFQSVLKEKRLVEYLKKNDVAYLAQHAIWNRPDVVEGTYQTWRFSLRSHLFDVDSDVVKVASTDEVYRSPSYINGGQETVFIIWRIPQTVF